MSNKIWVILLGVWGLGFAPKQMVDRGEDTKNWRKDWQAQELEKAHTAKGIPYMDTLEQEVVQLVNLARLFPEKFSERVLKPFLDTTHRVEKNSRFVQSLEKELASRNGVVPLHPNRTLAIKANEWAKETGEKGIRGHSDYQKRMGPMLKKYQTVAENCSFGYQKPLTIVTMLLIDKNQPGTGHRKAMLKKEHVYIGVAIGNHKTMRTVCVQEYGGKRK